MLCSHFQQFLHWEMSRFIFTLQIVAMCLPILKHLLISILPFFPLWVSQTSIQMTAMSNLGEAFITPSFNTSVRSLKMWLALIIASMLSDLIGVLVLFMKNGIPMIFKYNFDWGSLRIWTSSELMLSMLFTYLSITRRSNCDTTELETIVIPKLSGWMKSTETFDLMFLEPCWY